MKYPLPLLCVCAANLMGCGLSEEAQEYGHSSGALVHRSPLAQIEDNGDLRLEARQIIDYLSVGLTPPPVSFTLFAFSGSPSLIKVWRRSYGGDSCTGRVDILPLEDYVKGVLPHEWVTSWNKESLKAGSVAIRTYAAYWIAAGGKYKCADLCDTASSQVYQETTHPVTNAAIDATRGEVLLTNSKITFAEYSAENGDPTHSGVEDAVCAGKAVNGHGRGMCQWGSQRWAQQGKDYQWIVRHYYPQATLWAPSKALNLTDGSKSIDADTKPTSDLYLDSKTDFVSVLKDGNSSMIISPSIEGNSSADNSGAQHLLSPTDGGSVEANSVTEPVFVPNNILYGGCAVGGQLGAGDHPASILFIFLFLIFGIILKTHMGICGHRG